MDSDFSLYTTTGQRKYIDAAERARALVAVKQLDPAHRTFCLALLYGGGRISEVIETTPNRIDLQEHCLMFRTLKQGKDANGQDKVRYRRVPVPESFTDALDLVHGIRRAQMSAAERDKQLWPWCRKTAWSRVEDWMKLANIEGPQACPKGLRHGFAVNALSRKADIVTVSRWLGHTNLQTTTIYTQIVGPQEREIATQTWDD